MTNRPSKFRTENKKDDIKMIFPRIIDNGIAKQWEKEIAHNTKRLIVKALTI